MIASDIDGTLLDYDYSSGQLMAGIWPLLRRIAERTDTLALITNQGGLPWGVLGMQRKDGRPYPKPADFFARFVHLAGACSLAGIKIAALHVCVFHPKAPASAIYQAGDMLEQEFRRINEMRFFPAFVHTVEVARKPSPWMLLRPYTGAITCYYGDSDEDAQAAEAAGVEFMRVDRFFGGEAAA